MTKDPRIIPDDEVMSEPLCAICGRDNRNATHTALEAYGHLAHPFAPPTVIDAAHLERQRAEKAEAEVLKLKNVLRSVQGLLNEYTKEASS